MQNFEEYEQVPTSHYHLSFWHVFCIVSVFLALGIIAVLVFFGFEKQEPVVPISPTPTPVADAPVQEQNWYITPEYLKNLEGTGTSVSVVYPPEYELIEAKAESGMLKHFVLKNSQANSNLPQLLDFSLSTVASLKDSTTKGSSELVALATKEFELEKSSLEQKKEIDGRQLMTFDSILFFVQNVQSGTTNSFVREYVTFAGGTRIDIRIAIPSPSLSMQADELFHQVHLVAVKSD